MNKLKFTFLTFLTLLLHFKSAAQFDGGDLDPTFNNGEVSTAGLDLPGGNTWGAAVQSDGKILVFMEQQGNYLVRFNSDGTLDTDFGTNGSTFLMENRSRSLLVRADGKIILGTREGSIIALNSDGNFDTNFTIVPPTPSLWFYGLSEFSDGKIFATGWNFSLNNYITARFNSDGSLDNTYGTDGYQNIDLGTEGTDWGRSAQELSDGSILIIGNSSSNPEIENRSVLVKVDNSGVIDNSFGTDGSYEVNLGGVNTCNKFHILSDGKILLVGSHFDQNQNQYAYFLRLNADGTLDTSYGNDGYLFDSAFNAVNANGGFNIEGNTQHSALLNDGKIIVNGSFTSDNTSLRQAAIKRYTPNGLIDISYGINGLATAAITGKQLFFTWVFPDADDNVIQVGKTQDTSSFLVDVFVCKYLGSEIVGTLDFGLKSNSLLIYPNPVESNCALKFTLNEALNLDIRLTDINGKLLRQFYANQKFEVGDHQLNLTVPSSLPTGNYFVTISNKGVPVSVQIFKK